MDALIMRQRYKEITALSSMQSKPTAYSDTTEAEESRHLHLQEPKTNFQP